ncbi:MAG: glycosyltransferase family 39 protein [Pirellulaceae bacterium]|nr:glycosyltransferase family 39 protein [Pirellulaceae bacterium]
MFLVHTLERVRERWNASFFDSAPDTLPSSSTANSAGRSAWLGMSADAQRYVRLLQLLLLLVVPIFLIGNLNYPLLDRSETRVAEIARETLVLREWSTLHLNFQDYYDKPPLLYWLCALSFLAFGVHEHSARFVPVLAAAITILAVYWFARRNFNSRTAVLCGVVLALSLGFAFMSRYLVVDGLFTSLITLSLFFGYEAIKPIRQHTLRDACESTSSKAEIPDSANNSLQTGVRVFRPRLSWWCLSAACCGLAVLAKGPVAGLLWIPPLFVMALLTRGFARPTVWHWALGAVISLGISVPWIMAAMWTDPHYLLEFLGTHNLQRFAGEFHPRPFWFYVPVILIAGHPWSFLTIPYIQFLCGARKYSGLQRPTAVGFLLLASLWCLLFFSASRGKLPTYILPCAPLTAIMFAHFLDQLLFVPLPPGEWRLPRIWSPWMSIAATVAGGVVLVGHSLSIGFVSPTELILCSIALLVVVAISYGMWQRAAGAKALWAWSAITMALLLFFSLHVQLPKYSASRTLLGAGSPLTQQLSSAQLLQENAALHGETTLQVTPILTVGHQFPEVPFYLNRNDIQNFTDADNADITAAIQQQPNSLIIAEPTLTDDDLQALLPPGKQLTPGPQRSICKVWYVTSSPPQTPSTANHSNKPIRSTTTLPSL